MKKRRRRKYPTSECAGFKIRQLGPNSFMADVCTLGQRERKCFATLEQAETFCEQKKIETKNKGTAAFDILDRDRLDIVAAREKLGTIPLMEAVEFYVLHHPTTGTITVKELIPEYLKAPGKRGKNKTIKRRPDSLKGAQWRLNAFARNFGDRNIHEITTQEIEKWLVSNDWDGLNRRHYLASVTALYNYAIRKKRVTLNPAASIEKPDIITGEPDIMTPKNIEKILNTAAKSESGRDLLPRLAISFFCGLRPRELDRLRWENVSLENRLITVGKDVAKIQGHRRTVEISNCLLAWLVTCRRTPGKVWPYGSTTYNHKKKSLFAKTKVKLPYDAGRRCFASFHLAMHQNAALTAEMLGHPDATLLKKTYSNINTMDGRTITKKVAETFWSIRPQQEAKIIQLAQAG